MSNGNGSKFKWLVGPVITLAIVFCGFVASWATTKSVLNEMRKDQAKVEEKIEDLEDDVHKIELKDATDSSLLESLKEDVQIIKSDVKKILNHE